MGGARAQSPANVNGGFESSALGEVVDPVAGIEGWLLESSVSPPAQFSVVGDVTHSGDRALQISINAVGANVYDIQAIAVPIAVSPGQVYRFSVWARAASGTQTANFTVGNAAFMEYGRLDQQTLTTTWQEFAFDFTVTDDQTEIRAPIHVSFPSNAGGAVYIDDLRIASFSSPGLPDDPIGAGADKFLGNIYSDAQRPSFENYWNQVTPENAGKWGQVEAQRDVMTWQTLDAAYALAKDNGFPFHFHVLVWGRTQPTWMKDLSNAEQLEEIDEWFRAVADRYPDIDFLEVVNEPLHDPPNDVPDEPDGGGYIEALGGAGETGWDWVITAYEMAREIFPEETPLMINDYNILSTTAETARYLEIIDLLIQRDLLDKIGVQGHAFSTRPGAPLGEVLDLLATRGLPIQITELDVDGNPNSVPTLSDALSDRNQLQAMQRVFPVLWEHPAVEGITLWGWRLGHWRTEQDAFLVRATGQERPALDWMRTYVAEQIATPTASGAGAGRLVLLPPRPNPARTSAEVRFSLAKAADVTLSLYDALGRRVSVLATGFRSAGEHEVTVPVSRLPSGVYIYRLESDSNALTRQLVVVR